MVNRGLSCKLGTNTADRIKIMVASGRNLVLNKGLSCKYRRLVVNKGLCSKWGMLVVKRGHLFLYRALGCKWGITMPNRVRVRVRVTVRVMV